MADQPKTVLAHGVFDVLHHGHIAFLEEAAKLGELTVSITADEFVNKGPGRPVFSAEQRSDVIFALKFVKRVMLSMSESAVDIINVMKPDYYVKGMEYQAEDVNGMLTVESEAVMDHGGAIYFIDTPTDSSSRAINVERPTFPEAAQEWVSKFRIQAPIPPWDYVKSWLEEAAKLDFSIVGEYIIDRYEYVDPAGQSPKEGYTSYIPTGEVDEWDGGIGVIRDHVQQISKNSGCPTSISGFTVTKTRYVQQPFLKKVFSKAKILPHMMRHIDGSLWPSDTIGKSENRIIADFGHGLFDRELMDEVYKSSEWIAATIQANSLNFGFNRINKWGPLDYISCDRTELELANPAHYAKGIDHAANEMMKLHFADVVAVTLGHEGAKVFVRDKDSKQDYYAPVDSVTVPAFNDHAVDRIGAGDAWFGWTAPLVRAGAPIEVIAFVGACAAAVHVSTVGNAAAKANEVHGFMKSILS